MKNKLMVDTATIIVKAGNGGTGIVSFLHEAMRAKGGPDGGNGGDGGDVYFLADSNMATLRDFRSKTEYRAENGQPGSGKQMTGAGGNDLIIKVPLGTQIFEISEEREVLIGDITKAGEKLLVSKGGIGGRGNAHFKSAVNRTPREFTEGESGEKRTVRLEIKLIADIGLIGLPNAGKSTLINQMAGTSAKVGSYPFTTLQPNLGTCLLKNGRTIIVADLPGLIEGASEGRGLGDEFLRHVERTRLLIHLIDPYNHESVPLDRYALSSYWTIRKELKNYGAGLSDKKEIVVINKIDLTEVKEFFEKIKKAFKKYKIKVIGISAATGEGVEVLKEIIMLELEKVPKGWEFDVKKPVKVYTISNLPNRRIVFKSKGP